MKRTIIIALGLLVTLTTFAQNETDALRYSFLMNSGTARFSSMGSSFSALGADFSSLSTNPAGIGVYKSSEFMFTPQITFSNASSSYLGTLSEDSKASFSIPNVGIVFAGDISSSPDKIEWKNVQFGFGINRLADFNNNYLMRGHNSENSILDVYQYLAEGHHFDNLNLYDTRLAFDTWLIDTAGTVDHYEKAFEGGVLQQKSIASSGGINEMVISFGGNYNNRLYLGATLGFPFLNYNETAYYKETDDADTIANFKSLSVNDVLNTTGTGFNFKLGMIYRITDWVRISGAVHTPTFYAMHDTYSRVMKSDLETGTYSSDDYDPVNGVYDYRLSTPMKLIGGISFVIGKMGAISAEYEMVDYTQAKFRSTDIDYDFFDANEAISTNYTVANNFRVGGELILAPFAIRAGYSYYGSPYAGSYSQDYSINNISAGFGIRDKNYYIDIAYVYSIKHESYDLYNASIIESLGMNLNPVLTDVNRSSILITLGAKFGGD